MPLPLIALPGGAAPLAPFQMSYLGLTWGDGYDAALVQIDGIDGLPAIVQPDTVKGRDVGEYLGAYFPGGRDVVVDVEITSTSDAALRADIDALGSVTAPVSAVESPLAYLLPGMAQASRVIYCRPAARAAIINLDYVFHKATMTLKFHATDPRIYDGLIQVQSTGLPAGGGGVTWPAVWPISWGSAGGSGTMNVTNSGTYATRPVVTIFGPVDNPTIENTTAGKHMTFALTLAATDTLTVDFRAKTVLLNGTGNRIGARTPDSQWWELAPGTSLVSYRANTVSTGSIARITWQSAWI